MVTMFISLFNFDFLAILIHQIWNKFYRSALKFTGKIIELIDREIELALKRGGCLYHR